MINHLFDNCSPEVLTITLGGNKQYGQVDHQAKHWTWWQAPLRAAPLLKAHMIQII